MLATPGTGLIGIVVLLILLVAGMPVGVALGLVGIVGLAITLGPEPALIKSGVIVFDTLTRYELGTLPLFLLIAHLTLSANASRDFFDAAARFVGHRRGGLAIASVGGCAGFSAINGSSLATAATIGLVALPEMRSRGYSDALAAGAVAAGGTLGPMIPPSAALIVFGIIAQQSIGTLFTAAIIPGITQTLLYFAVVWILVRLKPAIAPPMEKASWPERLAAVKRIADVSLLIVIMIGGIVVGWFSPSEAASVGVVGVLIICAVRRRLGWAMLRHAFEETLSTSGLIFVIIIGALIFAVFMSVTGVATSIGTLIADLDAGRVVTTLVIALFLLVLGSVLDGLALMLLTTPILLPIVTGLGMSPIWFGIFLVRTMEIGFVHPPIGMNLYVIQRIAKDIPLSRIFKGVLPFLAADFVHVLLIILFPAIVLALPHWVGQ
jgi:tripartite ATP-independent transporter DctM subunit